MTNTIESFDFSKVTKETVLLVKSEGQISHEQFQAIYEAIKTKIPPETRVICMDSRASLHLLSEKAMNEAGWYRKDT